MRTALLLAVLALVPVAGAPQGVVKVHRVEVQEAVMVMLPREIRRRSSVSNSASNAWSCSGRRMIALKYLLLSERTSTR